MHPANTDRFGEMQVPFDPRGIAQQHLERALLTACSGEGLTKRDAVRDFALGIG